MTPDKSNFVRRFMLKIFTPQDIQSYIGYRAGETRLGEKVWTPEQLKQADADAKRRIQYVVLGIEEDLGVKANGGVGGAHTGFRAFLKAILNIQSNEFLSGAEFLFLGTINHLDTISEYDEVVYTTLMEVFNNQWMPIVIGGGHNNAYPILKALSAYCDKPVGCINIDPHADLRSTEERHSGNGFSFAITHGYLGRYAMVGLHQSYNNQYMLDKLKDTSTYKAVWWEDIFLKGTYSWSQAIQQGLYFVAQDSFGVELDIDAIENTLSSAMTPVGLTTQQACQALFMLGMHPNASYLHLPEAVLERADGLKQATIGKLLTYLVTSFVKGRQEID